MSPYLNEVASSIDQQPAVVRRGNNLSDPIVENPRRVFSERSLLEATSQKDDVPTPLGYFFEDLRSLKKWWDNLRERKTVSRSQHDQRR